jgi:general secretion pathway protein G
MKRSRFVARHRASIHRARIHRGAFTLMEVLLVLAILVILGGLVTMSYVNIRKNSNESTTLTQLNLLKSALNAYNMDIGRYPDTNQGLAALVQPPADLRNPSKWKRPYLDSGIIPADVWDNPFFYESAGPDQFRLWSAGSNGENESGVGDDILVESF